MSPEDLSYCQPIASDDEFEQHSPGEALDELRDKPTYAFTAYDLLKSWGVRAVPGEAPIAKEAKYGLLNNVRILNNVHDTQTIDGIIAQWPALKVVYSFGIPGSGKTSIDAQLVTKLRENYGYLVSPLSFEDSRREAEKTYGPLPQWQTIEPWQYASKNLQDKIDLYRQYQPKNGQRHIVVVEAASGFSLNPGRDDPAASTAQYFAKDARASTYNENEILFLRYVPNPLIWEDAMNLRDEIGSWPDTNVEQLLEKYNLRYYNLAPYIRYVYQRDGRDEAPDADDPAVRGRVLKDLILLTANAERINRYRKHLQKRTKRLNRVRKNHYPPMPEEVFAGMAKSVDSKVENRRRRLRKQYREYARSEYYRLQDDFKLDDWQSLLIANPFHADEIAINCASFIETELDQVA